MSRRADIARAQQGGLFRGGRSIHVAPGETIHPEKGDLVLLCGVCNKAFSEDMAEAHLKVCQPNGAKCGKCGQKIMPDQFMQHFKGCLGNIAHELVAVHS